MTSNHTKFIEIASMLLEKRGRHKIDFHEMSEYLGISHTDVWDIVEMLKAEGHLDFHPSGGFILTGKHRNPIE